jgi:cytochrome c oxidase subunit 3
VSFTMPMDPTQSDPNRVAILHPAQVHKRTTSSVGMIIFLGSWAVMFASLFFGYGMHRAASVSWPPPGFEPLPLLVPGINTILIIVSSVFLYVAGRQFRQGDGRLSNRWLSGTMLLGAVFLALQLSVWTALWQSGMTLRSGGFASYFYLLTVFHALHVVVGLGLLGWVGLMQRRVSAAVKQPVRLRLATMFWHFVGVAWVLTYTFVYVL